MLKRLANCAAVLPFLLLAACGGDSGGDTPPVIVTPTPTPTPVPTPTPTPVPVAYPDPFDFTRQSNFQSPMVQAKFREVPDPTTPSGYRLDYAITQFFETPLASVGWNLVIPDQPGRPASAFGYTYSGGGHSLSTVGRLALLLRNDENGFLLERLTIGGTRLDAEVERYAPNIRFVAGVNFHSRIITSPKLEERNAIVRDFMLGGQRSDAIELPVSGGMTYSGKLKLSEIPSGTADFFVDAPNVSVSYTSGVVTGIWMFGSRRFELTGAVHRDRLNRIEGVIRTADGEFSGRFVGDLYGPRAQELGILISMKNADFAVAGSFIGTSLPN